ncbi:hypothetical protein [Chryseobacterium sp. NFX27]|uniref:hypothetical protein n=1 Tax=Chryseobacterium sp. NFX27 TaxID=2819618 RepID=UPI003CEB1477
MRANIILIILMCSLLGCKSPEAGKFREEIVKNERIAFNIVLSKDSYDEQKLESLIKNDFKGALVAVDKQSKQFDSLIQHIKGLPAENIAEGPQLKEAAINYYTALKDLHYFDRKEIEQQEVIFLGKDKYSSTSSNRLIELARQKKRLYEKVYQQEDLLKKAFTKFDLANR